MEPAVILVWKLRTVYVRMFEATAILSCVIKIRGLFKSSKWRHFENVKFEALSARSAQKTQRRSNRVKDWPSTIVEREKSWHR